MESESTLRFRTYRSPEIESMSETSATESWQEMGEEERDEWDDTDATRQCEQLRVQVNQLTSQLQLLAQKSQDQEKECANLRETLEVVNSKATKMEATIKDHQSNLSNDTCLYSISPLYRRMKFRLWLHDTYSQLTESDSRNPTLNIPLLTSELRTLIFPNTIDPPAFIPRHMKTEEEYKSQLNSLHLQINAFIKRMIFKKEVFTRDDLAIYLELLRRFSRTGEKTFEKFGEEIVSTNFGRKEVHQKLWKCLFGMILFERILSCFAFRMDERTSKQLYAIENAILTSDADYETVLGIRQLLGTVALQYVDNIQTVQKKQDLTIEITGFLSPLINCKEEDIYLIVSSAVDLRNDMTRELAFYSCYWFGVDSKVDLDSVFCEFEGWRDDEGFPLCVFPGFGEMYKLGDGSIKEVCVKRAVVELGWYQGAETAVL